MARISETFLGGMPLLTRKSLAAPFKGAQPEDDPTEEKAAAPWMRGRTRRRPSQRQRTARRRAHRPVAGRSVGTHISHLDEPHHIRKFDMANYKFQSPKHEVADAANGLDMRPGGAEVGFSAIPHKQGIRFRYRGTRRNRYPSPWKSFLACPDPSRRLPRSGRKEPLCCP